ncbi:hypothetical protein [Pseudocolwellia sp. HL-MZ7]|uniref:hypothetical protein n=1 Tax=Pseudocolwellia sp. HL-MZ7 TaxID=3400627 RepID=UPI003CEC9A5B
MTINWNNTRPLDNSQNEGFEELVCQLARNESIPNKKEFIRKEKTDAGVECFWILDNDGKATNHWIIVSCLHINKYGLRTS